MIYSLPIRDKAISGFRTAGIYPLNPDKFTGEDFAHANQIRPLKFLHPIQRAILRDHQHPFLGLLHHENLQTTRKSRGKKKNDSSQES
ncbi:unnamed protein product [Acanthoscelides obtectus]|uniref:Uncharacterized protein n=1 Tax=Acanthoscelides obtectus TaxID=200917 RepID=A0A9P0K369_ACAOB|nr:unnamed protein product [Acanthoscelides obtectus]CAK1649360.1 hypothetical protein AOBTE_LOCUS16182 [Acanthoscelides obtectus]